MDLILIKMKRMENIDKSHLTNIQWMFPTDEWKWRFAFWLTSFKNYRESSKETKRLYYTNEIKRNLRWKGRKKWDLTFRLFEELYYFKKHKLYYKKTEVLLFLLVTLKLSRNLIYVIITCSYAMQNRLQLLR